jgi:hypothetical protein
MLSVLMKFEVRGGGSMRARVKAFGAILVGIGLLRLTVPVVAHHAFSAEFDASKPIKLEGVVTKMEWINPHSWIHLDVKRKDGKTESWMVEGGAPNALLRRGFSRESLPVGTRIIVDGYQAKDGARRANGRDLTFADGKKLFMGSSGTGAPLDGRDPTEKPK